MGATVVEAEADPVDVRPMGLECFPHGRGLQAAGLLHGGAPGWAQKVRAGHVLSAMVTHLWAHNRMDDITSPDDITPLAP